MRYKVNKEVVIPTKSGTLYLNTGAMYNTANNPLTSCGKNMLQLLLDHEFIEEVGDEWKPKEGETYYIIHSESMVGSKEYDSRNSVCEEQIDMGNCFQFKWQAEAEVAKRRAKVILLKDSKGYTPDPKDQEFCYQVRIRTGTTLLDVAQIRTDVIYEDGIFFYSYAAAAKSLEEHRKEWLTLFNLHGEVKDEEIY